MATLPLPILGRHHNLRRHHSNGKRKDRRSKSPSKINGSVLSESITQSEVYREAGIVRRRKTGFKKMLLKELKEAGVSKETLTLVDGMRARFDADKEQAKSV